MRNFSLLVIGLLVALALVVSAGAQTTYYNYPNNMATQYYQPSYYSSASNYPYYYYQPYNYQQNYQYTYQPYTYTTLNCGTGYFFTHPYYKDDSLDCPYVTNQYY